MVVCNKLLNDNSSLWIDLITIFLRNFFLFEKVLGNMFEGSRKKASRDKFFIYTFYLALSINKQKLQRSKDGVKKIEFLYTSFSPFLLLLHPSLIMLFIFGTLCWSRLLMLFSFELIAYDIDKHRFASCSQAFIDFVGEGKKKWRFKFPSVRLLSSSSPEKGEKIYFGETKFTNGNTFSMEISSHSIFSFACVHL